MMFRITTLVKVLFVLKAIFLVSLICLKLELFTFGEKVGLAETEKKENLKEASVENPKKKPRSLMEKLLKLQPLDRTKGSLKQIGKYLDMADKRREEVNARINLLEKQIQSLRKIEKAVTNKISAIKNFNKMLNMGENLSPLKRNVTSEHVGNASLYLVSDLSSGTTGEIHHVDSGYNILAAQPVSDEPSSRG